MQLKDLYAYRFYDKSEGPLRTIRTYNIKEIIEFGKKAGVTNIVEIYKNRIKLENMMYDLFVKKGGRPNMPFPLYFAVYNELPQKSRSHVRFKEPYCLRIPVNAFSREHISFTYGLSTRAFTRKDGHPLRRKLLLLEDVENVINDFPYDEDEELWFEMQVWDERIIQEYYKLGTTISSHPASERLTPTQQKELMRKYDPYMCLINPEYFYEPDGVHGVSHAKRVVVLTQELAEFHHLDSKQKELLLYCAIFHDIGRTHNLKDNKHGFKSYLKLEQLNVLPLFDKESKQVIRFIIENHQLDIDLAKSNMKKYNLKCADNAFYLYSIFRDSDILDRCRFCHVDVHYLFHKSSRDFVSLAYQLLLMYREKLQ